MGWKATLVRNRYLVLMCTAVFFAEGSHLLGFADGTPVRGFDWAGVMCGALAACAAAGWIVRWERQLQEEERRRTPGVYPRY